MCAYRKPKTFADCYLYGLSNDKGYSASDELLTFVNRANRIDVSSDSFKNIVNSLKSRAQSAIPVKMLQQSDTVLCISPVKELNASFKVFRAKDPKSNKFTKKVFIDCTGLITQDRGFFICKEIDKLAAYLMAAAVIKIYEADNAKMLANGNLSKAATSAFIKMATSIIDKYRLPNYDNNRDKIKYIFGVYFAYNVIRLDIDSARNMATSATGFSRSDTKTYDYYYSYEDDFKDIATFITFIANTFKLKGIEPAVFLADWLKAYGKGTLYGVELYPSFLITLIYAYSGAYINNVKKIEYVTDNDMKTVYTTFTNIASTTFTGGFHYESAADREHYKHLAEIDEDAKNILSNRDDKQPGCPFTVTSDFFKKYAENHGLEKDDLEIQKFIDKINHDIAIDKAAVAPVLITEPVKESACNTSGVCDGTKEKAEAVTQDALDKHTARTGSSDDKEINDLKDAVKDDVKLENVRSDGEERYNAFLEWAKENNVGLNAATITIAHDYFTHY